MSTLTFAALNDHSQIPVRSLNVDEVDQVSGGVLPALGALAALAAHVGVGGTITSAAGHVLSGLSLGYSIFSAASHYGSGGVKKTRMEIDKY